MPNNTLAITNHELKLKYKEQNLLKEYYHDLKTREDGDLVDVLWNPYDILKKQLKEWCFQVWNPYQFANVPYQKHMQPLIS